MNRPVKFFAGNNTKHLAAKIANAFGYELNSSSMVILENKNVSSKSKYEFL